MGETTGKRDQALEQLGNDGGMHAVRALCGVTNKEPQYEDIAYGLYYDDTPKYYLLSSPDALTH
jgi:hypothetical protein